MHKIKQWWKIFLSALVVVFKKVFFVVSQIDIRDIILGVALWLMWSGISEISVWLAKVVIGVTLLILWSFPKLQAKREGK